MMTTHMLLLIVPLVVSNILHMVAVKKNWLAPLAVPLSVPLFGEHKTWRGFLLLTLLNGAALALIARAADVTAAMPAFWLGAALGFAYMLFELPNSYLKRRLGITPGAEATNNKLFFRLLDKTDSAFGVCLTYFLLSDVFFYQVALLFLLSSTLHSFFSYLLVSLNYKKSF